MGGSWAAAEAKGRNSAFDLKKVTLSNKLDSLFGYIPEGWQPLARGRGRNAADTPGRHRFMRIRPRLGSQHAVQDVLG